jgi:hypothetical protein
MPFNMKEDNVFMMFAKIVKCPAVNIASILSSFWYIYTRQWSCNKEICVDKIIIPGT